MENFKFDLKATGGKIKPMNAANNGPVVGAVRTGSNNLELYKALEIPYARNHDASFFSLYGGEHTVDVHRIFKNFDADENDPASYIFEPTDRCVAVTFEAGTKVFYRLGASIEHYYKYGTVPPKDYEKWARICEHIIRHYTEGWANGYKYDIEYWEIWNEPDCENADGSNPCWQGTFDEFCDFYCVVSKYLKEKFPHLKIGGPAFCSSHPSEYKDKFFSTINEKGGALDFFSYHRYAETIEKFAKATVDMKEVATKYGFGDAETILNEWNYVRAFFGEQWTYSVEMEKALKGASFVAGAMLVCQKMPLDMLMYYDLRPCTMNGVFTDKYKPLKAYWSFIMFRNLRRLGTELISEHTSGNVYACGATDGKESGVMLTYFDDNDDAEAQEVKLSFENSEGAVKVYHYVTDENKDNELVSEEFFSADKFNIYVKATLYSTHYFKIEKV